MSRARNRRRRADTRFTRHTPKSMEALNNMLAAAHNAEAALRALQFHPTTYLADPGELTTEPEKDQP